MNKDIIDVYEEETVVEDVAFVVIEDVPIFPGCSGNKEQLRSLFFKKNFKICIKEF